MRPYKWVVTIISAFLMFFNRYIPPVMGLNETGMAVLCIFIGTMAMLLTVDLCWPFILCVLAYVDNGVYTLSEALSNSLGNSVFWFVAFSGLLITAMDDSGVIKRIACWFLTRPYNKGHPWRFICSLFFATMIIGSFMDPTALIILLIALVEEILHILGLKRGSRFGELIMLGVLVFVGLSYGITPIGHPVPVMMISMFGEIEPVSFLEYSIVGYAVSIIYFIFVILLMRFVFRLDVSVLKQFDPSVLSDINKPLDKKGKITCVVYVVVIILWMLPNFVQNLLPGVYSKLNEWGTISPLFIGIIALNLIQVNGKPIMNFGSRIKDIPWQACMPCASALLIGGSLSHADAGITDALANYLGPLLQGVGPHAFVIVICLFCTILTNFSSDMVTAVLGATISLTLIESGIVQGVNITGLCVAIGICASCAYATPPGAAYASIIAGHGWVRVREQLLEGGLCAIVASLSSSLVGYNLACMLY